MAYQQFPIRALANRHRHAMNFYRPNERGTYARACFYSAYRCARVQLQAGILDAHATPAGFYGEACQALRNRGAIQEVANAEV